MRDFVSLFDGKTLTGWHSVPRLDPSVQPGTERHRRALRTSGRWEVRDGAIVGGQELAGYGGYLLTDGTYGDFELRFEARPEWPVDTGVLVRATARGYEGFQVLIDHRKSGGIGGFYGNCIGGFHAIAHTIDARYDNAGHPVGLVEEDPAVSLEPVTPAKRALLSYAASPQAFLETWRWNDWNRFKIRCERAHPLITVWINDIKVAQLDAATIRHDGYDPRVAARLLGRRGHIALEVHDNDPLLGEARWGPGAVCRWRNIGISAFDSQSDYE